MYFTPSEQLTSTLKERWFETVRLWCQVFTIYCSNAILPMHSPEKRKFAGGKIVSNYLGSWFPIDILASLPLEYIVLIFGLSGSANLTYFAFLKVLSTA